MVLAQLDPTGIFDLGNTSLIFWEVMTFLILLFLLVRYVYPPIRKQIQERQSQIEQSIDEAEKTRARPASSWPSTGARSKRPAARGAASWTRPASRREAQRERTKREAREEGDRIIQRAREEIERERESAVREVRSEVADMVVQASEQVIGRSIDRDEHERLISQALDDLEAEVAGAEERDRLSAVSTYAEALFEAARERDELEEVLSDLGEFVDRPARERGAAGCSSTEARSPSARSAGRSTA